MEMWNFKIKDYTEGKKLSTRGEVVLVLMYIYGWDTIKTDDIILIQQLKVVMKVVIVILFFH